MTRDFLDPEPLPIRRALRYAWSDMFARAWALWPGLLGLVAGFTLFRIGWENQQAVVYTRLHQAQTNAEWLSLIYRSWALFAIFTVAFLLFEAAVWRMVAKHARSRRLGQASGGGPTYGAVVLYALPMALADAATWLVVETAYAVSRGAPVSSFAVQGAYMSPFRLHTLEGWLYLLGIAVSALFIARFGLMLAGLVAGRRLGPGRAWTLAGADATRVWVGLLAIGLVGAVVLQLVGEWRYLLYNMIGYWPSTPAAALTVLGSTLWILAQIAYLRFCLQFVETGSTEDPDAPDLRVFD